MGNSRLTTGAPVSEGNLESQPGGLTNLYAFVVECHKSRQAADVPGDQDEVKEVQDVDPRQRIP